MVTGAPAARAQALPEDGGAYARIWRWHFYAGLFVLPFVLILAITGAIYLFKPQIDRWEERATIGLGTRGAVSADAQLASVLDAEPGGRFVGYRLPRATGDAAMFVITRSDGHQRQVFVSPQGEVIARFDPDTRISETVARIHGSLLLGEWGDRLVELAASWTIVLILSGLYLWWPRPLRAAGTLWPRLSLRGRPLLKDLHRVAGFWIAGLVLVMLASGLPWAGTWGSAFKWARAELGLIDGPQDWKIGGHGGRHGAPPPKVASQPKVRSLPLSAFVIRAQGEAMAFPVMVYPPRAPQRFGPPTGEVWTVKSEAQNRTLDRLVAYDPATGAQIARHGFADQHPIDRLVNTGVAWHEGQLFGAINQLIGLLTAVVLLSLSVLGTVMWLKRRPRGQLGAPPGGGKLPRWTIAMVAALCLLLPLFGASVALLALGEVAASRIR